MADVKRVRIIKRGQSEQISEPVQATGQKPARDSGREMKGVVSGWVREHSRRADEFRQNYSTLLKELGFAPPLSCRT
ncbi:MAG: hypothetical protein H7Z38_05920 [Rubrivivax sp.]|nr:hypothetical protein [Pyrinomonadaceae bacterium]